METPIGPSLRWSGYKLGQEWYTLAISSMALRP